MSRFTLVALLAAMGPGCTESPVALVEGQPGSTRIGKGEKEDRQEPDFSGRYTYTGTNPDGSKYRGDYIIEIRKTSKTYQILWTKQGEDPSQGIGIVDQGKLYVGYDQAPGVPGVIIYTPGPNGTLSGAWTWIGQEATGTETLTPIR